MKQYQSFKEFWPFYLSQHLDVTCRALHYLGTFGACCLLTWVIVSGSLVFIPLALVFGYGFAWIGHFIFEKNKPATFEYPFWSFIADYKMSYMALTGKLEEELEKLSSH